MAKRLKRVFDTSQCAHVWAQQSQPDGRNASNSVHFDGATFFSYQTPIAQFCEPRGYWPQRVVLVNGDYSMTTKGKHLPAVRHALRGLHGVMVFDVPYVDISGARGWHRLPKIVADVYGDNAKRWQSVHELNAASLNREYSAQVQRYMRERTWSNTDVDHVTAYLEGIANTARAYAHVFGLPAPNFPCRADALNIIARRVRIESDPKRAAKRAAREAAAERARVARAAELAIANAERIAAFRAGDVNAPRSYLTDATGCAMLRVSADGERIETSLGANVPMEHARRALRLWHRCRAAGIAYPGEFEDTGLKLKLGHFSLDAIDSAGNVTAGCHRIAAAEVLALSERIMHSSSNLAALPCTGAERMSDEGCPHHG